MREFKVGDTVKLKSGGPIMTINEINGNEISCQWFDKKEVKGITLSKEVLKHDSASNGIHFGSI
ncbi:MAG: DUF2158 domain-containing protein [Bacteroidales bacterium]|jgi:uncharacterized protein YodC (DUF2158 family)